jgi:hypothetical protein
MTERLQRHGLAELRLSWAIQPRQRLKLNSGPRISWRRWRH